MKLTERSMVEFVGAVRTSEATPGGGSAAALAGAVGSALLAMVGSMPKNRAALEDEASRLREAGARCGALSARLTALVDEDSASYARVLEAYRLPKDSEAAREARDATIQEALRGAIETPLAVMRACTESAEAARFVAAYGYARAWTDVGVGLELLAAALRGARLNVEINLGSVSDAGYAEQVREEARLLASTCGAAIEAARAVLAGAP